MLYQPYPSTWPTYTPRDKLAHWLEQYATSQDLIVWTDSRPLPTPTYDPVTKKWTVVVDHSGKEVTIHPSHIVLATGTLGSPHIPNIVDKDLFVGITIHAHSYQGGRPFFGKRVVVVGAGNTSADICQDLCVQGAKAVTMVQRSTTCVVKASTIRANQERAWPAAQSTEISDFKFCAVPILLLKRMIAASAEKNWEREKDIHEGLKKAGLHLNMGSDGSGNLPMVFERLGGTELSLPLYFFTNDIQDTVSNKLVIIIRSQSVTGRA